MALPFDPDNVQFIATTEFMRTVLGNTDDFGMDIKNVLYDNYDFMIDPNESEYTAERGEREIDKGDGHPAEQKYRWARQEHSEWMDDKEAELRKDNPKLKQLNTQGPMPYRLLAMALHNSNTGKDRVVLTDDEGLIEVLQYYGIPTMGSADLLDTLQKDGKLSFMSADELKEKHERGEFSHEEYLRKLEKAIERGEQREAYRQAYLEFHMGMSMADEMHVPSPTVTDTNWDDDTWDDEDSASGSAGGAMRPGGVDFDDF